MPRNLSGLNNGPAQFRRKNSDNGMRLALVLTALSLVLFTFSGRESGSGPLTTIRGSFQVITTPVRVAGSFVMQPFQGLSNAFANLTADQETLSELKSENEQLTARNAELEEAEQTATRLQGLLNLQDTYDLQSTAARIISGSTDSWSSTVTIDKGSLSGIAVGMPVTDSAGVIGQTIEVSASSATVRLISDENSSVAAMVQSSRAQGMLNGSADGGLQLTMVTSDKTVSVGDTIVTSGLGGIFPKGLPLGTVTNVTHNAGSSYLDIEVEPLVSTENYEEVLVVTSLTEDQQATADDISSADAQDSSSTSTSNDSTSSSTADASSE
jgi:rod shape-determining protein MreC